MHAKQLITIVVIAGAVAVAAGALGFHFGKRRGEDQIAMDALASLAGDLRVAQALSASDAAESRKWVDLQIYGHLTQLALLADTNADVAAFAREKCRIAGELQQLWSKAPSTVEISEEVRRFVYETECGKRQ